jgi:uncharacterized protein
VTPQAGPALRLSILLSQDDCWHHRPLYAEIVRRAQHAGLAGATVVSGIEGYGRGDRIHTDRILSLCEDLPVQVIIVDDEDRIRSFLPQLEELGFDGLVLVDDVLLHRR